ncbi:transketolase [Spiroplasma mirum ATCC 29335]|uniref:Transketolase n=1 Tax=Spiroplasma mirum ATCC 29335 TaxID=838561 RepID=W0GPH5_9MOLU|nr:MULTISPECIES: transketolase [Spiroplasma]AHF60988.1 putative transketolase [Spiroplasma mirum ATCC 29335]AHI58009.1 transketolase [Spiroplasma mirum ATCC 29335]AKM53090.1 transketolase [Spiroplasma atrichopogonis]
MNKSINTVRMLGIEAVNKANSGHPGIILGAAPMAYTLFTKHLRVNPEVDKWINRDRFILSAGHGSALLYSLLHLSGFNITIDDLKKFRQLGSITPGHPESYLTPGVDVTTGPLGQGIAMAVGQAVAETHLSARYNKPNYNLFDHYTYVICGDGDLQEGVAQEAISLAGHWKLNKLIVLFDSNDVQLDNMVSVAQSENIADRFKAAQWNYLLVKDGNDTAAINKAIEQAKTSDKPTLIEVKTVIGFGATKQGTPAVHGSPLGTDIETVKKVLAWTEKDFYVPGEVYEDFETNVKERGIKEYDRWIALYEKYLQEFPDLGKELERAIHGNFTIKAQDFLDLAPSKPQATRVSSGKIVDRISELLPNWMGGSADLTGSTKAKGADGNYQFDNRLGRNIAYGVREFAMGAINNGIYTHGGILPFAGGFFVFADYIKPAIRLSSLMEIPVLYVLSHDSIAVGEDGPTHQPIEQLAMLRSQPNLNVFRPCDFKETLGSYLEALQQKHTPSAILITRQDLPELETTSAQDVNKGAYKVFGADHNNDVNILATGSEVSLAINVAKKLTEKNISAKVISMPCWELFAKQPADYQTTLLEKKALKVSLELGTTFGWERYTGNEGINIGIDTFGQSGNFHSVLEYFNFNVEHISNKIIKKLGK